MAAPVWGYSGVIYEGRGDTLATIIHANGAEKSSLKPLLTFLLWKGYENEMLPVL